MPLRSSYNDDRDAEPNRCADCDRRCGGAHICGACYEKRAKTPGTVEYQRDHEREDF